MEKIIEANKKDIERYLLKKHENYNGKDVEFVKGEVHITITHLGHVVKIFAGYDYEVYFEMCKNGRVKNEEQF
jgi:hypothetical protein